MAFRKWLIELLGGQTKSNPDQAIVLPPSNTSTADEEEVAGLNFRTAIEVHQKWKARLQTVIDGDVADVLSVEDVSRDDICALGKWLHGPGDAKYGTESSFKTLQTNHAHFHQCAGKVLQNALSGNKAEAQAALKSGDFAQASQVVVMDLAQMYTKISK
jgi:hypothetical protein